MMLGKKIVFFLFIMLSSAAVAQEIDSLRPLDIEEVVASGDKINNEIGLDHKDWAFNYSFIYADERYESVSNIPKNYALSWYTGDLSCTKSLRFKNTVIRVIGELNNIFNQQYEVVQCYPMPGINYKIKINVIL